LPAITDITAIDGRASLSFHWEESMSRMMSKTTSMLLLVVAALSGCESTVHRLSPFSWFHRRDTAFAYAAPSGLPQPAIAASVGSVPQPATATNENSQANATASPPSDPYAAGADEWAAGSASASSGSADSDYSSRGRSACTSGCCSRWWAVRFST